MPITVNEGGVLKTLTQISVNEGGALYNLDRVHANEGGVLQLLFQKQKYPGPESVSWRYIDDNSDQYYAKKFLLTKYEEYTNSYGKGLRIGAANTRTGYHSSCDIEGQFTVYSDCKIRTIYSSSAVLDEDKYGFSDYSNSSGVVDFWHYGDDGKISYYRDNFRIDSGWNERIPLIGGKTYYVKLYMYAQDANGYATTPPFGITIDFEPYYNRD